MKYKIIINNFSKLILHIYVDVCNEDNNYIMSKKHEFQINLS